MWWLHRDRRVTYRTFKHILGLDDSLLNDIRKELGLRRLAIDEDGEVLVWTGESQHAVQPEVTIPGQSAPEPIHTVPEAERRQLTVMFCDLADSTKLSQQLDPEDLREVIRAYQTTAAEVLRQYDGHIAQYLGDGLLVYFGWPVAHEDDAHRALHSGLGIVEAITTTLNPRLTQEKGVTLTVRLGVHTGPVVVGEMGGGDGTPTGATRRLHLYDVSLFTLPRQQRPVSGDRVHPSHVAISTRRYNCNPAR
jgi:class 3 adenylate cyclase